MNKGWKKAILIAVTLSLSVTALIWISQNDLSDLQWLRSSTSIESDLSELIDGKNFEEVRIFLRDHGSKIISASETQGFISRSGRGIGEKHIDAILGGYRMFFVSTDVSARIAFDQDVNILIVEVGKYKDSL